MHNLSHVTEYCNLIGEQESCAGHKSMLTRLPDSTLPCTHVRTQSIGSLRGHKLSHTPKQRD